MKNDTGKCVLTKPSDLVRNFSSSGFGALYTVPTFKKKDLFYYVDCYK